jgi:hypothetical protein
MSSMTSKSTPHFTRNIRLDAEVCGQPENDAPDFAYFRALQGFRNLYDIGYPDYVEKYRDAPEAICDT